MEKPHEETISKNEKNESNLEDEKEDETTYNKLKKQNIKNLTYKFYINLVFLNSYNHLF